jgi:hypothetical protein
MLEGAPWRRALDLAVVLGADALALLPAETIATPGRSDPNLVVVTDLRGLERARDRAASAVRDRVAGLVDLGFDPGLVLAAEGAVPGVHGQAVFLLHQTDGLTGLVAGSSPDQDAWLTAWRDPAGATDARFVIEARVRDDADQLIRRRLVASAEPAPTAWTVEARTAVVSVSRRDREAGIVTTGTVVVRAERDGASTLVLDLPRVHQTKWAAGFAALDSRFSVEDVRTADGQPLPWRFLDAASILPTRPVRIEVTVPPVARGGHADVVVTTVDNALLAHFAIGERRIPEWGWSAELYDLGEATSPLAVAAAVVHSAGEPPTVVDVRVPEKARLRAVTGGQQVPAAPVPGWVTTRAVHTSSAPKVAVGRWHTHEEPALGGMPAVRAATFQGWKRQQRALAIHVRQVLSFYDPLLPPYPSAYVDVAQLAAIPERVLLYLASPGIVPLPAGANTGSAINEAITRRDRPEIEWVMLGTNLAAQHWMPWMEHGPAGRGIGLAAAHTYGLLLVKTAFGTKVDAWDDTLAECALSERPTSMPIDELGWSAEGVLGSWCFATVALGSATREAVGDTAWLEAMDGLVSGRFTGDFDVAQVGAALSEVAGRDVRPLVDFWLASAIAPDVTAEWSVVDGGVEVRVRSSVPFGTYELPFEVRTDEETARGRVVVVDGVGRATLPIGGAPRSLTLDPDRRLLLASARVVGGEPGSVTRAE